MTDMGFTLIEKSSRPARPHQFFQNVVESKSAPTADHDYQYLKALREANEGMIVTAIPALNINLRAFAAAGFATIELDRETDSFASWRGYLNPSKRGGRGQVGENVHFAKYRYSWANHDFILYTVESMQYVLKERFDGEPPLGPSKATDALIQTIGDQLLSNNDVVWVYDGYWYQDRALFREVQKASWDKVILDEDMKSDLTKTVRTFFASKQVYEDLGVPWKRGLMFHGPPGNGKTVSIKAMMNDLLLRKNPIPTLYVKSAPYTFNIGQVFEHARSLAPCMLILEDVETIVKSDTRSYFFNELDGLSNNDGLFLVASTNYLDRLDPGLTNRPSRFDRKYLFPEPNEHERTLYCEYWRSKLRGNRDIEFPQKLSPAMAHVTPGFSFAFLQECFVATLLAIATEDTKVDGDIDLDHYKLWRIFKQQADILRKQLHNDEPPPPPFPAAIPHGPGFDTQRSSHATDSPLPGDPVTLQRRFRSPNADSTVPRFGIDKMTTFTATAFETRAP